MRQKKKLQEELQRLESLPKESIQDVKAFKIQSGIQKIEEAKARKLKLKAKLEE
jgi:virulence-associated protein VapD